MNLYALDENYDLCAILAPINVQWNRKYYEPGDFSIQIPANTYLPEMRYVYMPGRNELGMIQKPLYTNDVAGDTIQLIGMFSEAELNDKIVYPTFYANGNISDEVYEMVTQYKEDIPNLVIPESHEQIGDNIQFQETHANLSDTCFTKLQTQEMSYRIKYDFEAKTKTFEIWQGKDRTQAQEVNNFVVFSTQFGNINNATVEEDSSNFKNWALVGGSGEGKDRIYVEVDLSNGGYKKKIFIDASGENYDEEKQTLSEYKANLRQYGIEKMLDYQVIQNVDFISSESGYVYLQDYDLGDKCDVIIEPLQLSLEARIIAVYEVFKENIHTIELEFGNKRLTNYQKARLDR